MIQVSEWLPNPAGKDVEGEWFELVNTGMAPLHLSGWHVSTGGEKRYTLSGTINPGEYKVFPRSAVKASLKNTDGSVFLYGPDGFLADQASFVGIAPEGKSVNVTDRGVFFGDPTPGSPFVGVPYANIMQTFYPAGSLLSRDAPSAVDVISLLFSAGVALAAAMLYCVKHNDYLSELFFSKH